MEPRVAVGLKRKVEKMKKFTPFVAVLFMGWALATTALADELCKLPPGIETGERYVLVGGQLQRVEYLDGSRTPAKARLPETADA